MSYKYLRTHRWRLDSNTIVALHHLLLVIVFMCCTEAATVTQ